MKVAILGTGNIGSDLLLKIRNRSEILEVGLFAGIDPESEGLAQARRLGVPTATNGIEGVLTDPEIGLVFDATSASAHARHAPLLREAGKVAVDLTPAGQPGHHHLGGGGRGRGHSGGGGSGMSRKGFVRVVDTTLRDGCHSVGHQFTAENIRDVAGALDRARIHTIEVTHGDGLGGSSIQYGRGRLTDQEMLRAARAVVKRSRLAVLMLPGVGVKQDLEMAHAEGARLARIATHSTEADISAQHIRLAKDIGMDVTGFLMMSHMEGPEKLVEQAKLMESYGADTVYVVDSAGAMVPDEVRAKVSALRGGLSCEVGFHAHNNLGLAIGNSLAAIEEGAAVVDGSLAGLGAGAGNAPTEVLIAVLDKSGYETGVDLYEAMDAAEDIVRPLLKRPQVIDKPSLSLGYAGVYSSFLLHTFRVVKKLGLDPRDVLIELGRRRVVGGQEDMILDIAMQLKREKEAAAKDVTVGAGGEA